MDFSCLYIILNTTKVGFRVHVHTLSGTGIQQISHRFIYLKLVYCCFSLITELFGSLSRSLCSHTKKWSYYTVLQSEVQCSKEIVCQLMMMMVMLSRHVMSRCVTLPTLPSPYLTLRLQCQIWINREVTTIMWICSKCLNQMFKFKKKHCLSSTRLVITCYTLNSRPCSDCGISSRPEG